MNSNKISCQKYVFEQNEYNSWISIHENTNKPLDGAYLVDFGIYIRAKLDGGFFRAIFFIFLVRGRCISCYFVIFLTNHITYNFFVILGDFFPKKIWIQISR